jgi:hypothetical protein
MVGRLFVLSGIVMFGGFPVVMSGVRQMFRRLLVMLCGFLRHGIFLHYIRNFGPKLAVASF